MFESRPAPSTSGNNPAPVATGSLAWNAGFMTAVCPHCHWRYLIPSGEPQGPCPNCYQGPLSVLPEGLPDLPETYPPELIVPFRMTETKLAEAVHQFAAGIPFPPKGLNEAALRSRLLPIYLPIWLVDSQISARWEAEAGFNYEVVSHEELYNGDQRHWQTREVKEPRTRWENRVGQLHRSYQNVMAPAMDDARQIEATLGSFDLSSAQSFTQDCLVENGRQAYLRLPDHPPKEAWSETAAAFQKAAGAEVQQACSADRLRQFRWKANYSRLNWTLMLLPVYSAFYLDDDGNPQPVYIHGQTGYLNGSRKASLRKAQRTSLYLLLAGILLFLLGILLDTVAPGGPVSKMISTYMSILGIAGVVASVVPLLIVWDFNRRQALEESEIKN